MFSLFEHVHLANDTPRGIKSQDAPQHALFVECNHATASFIGALKANVKITALKRVVSFVLLKVRDRTWLRPLMRAFRRTANPRRRRLRRLASRLLAQTDAQQAEELLRSAAADAGGACSLLLVQHGAGGTELVTPLYGAAGGELPAAYATGLAQMPSVQQACASGQPLVLRHYARDVLDWAGEGRFADLDAFYAEASFRQQHSCISTLYLLSIVCL